MKSRSLKIAGGVAGLLLVGSLYGTIRRRQKDKLASQVLREVTRRIKPATKGLISEDAFDIHYTDEVLKHAKGRVLTLKASAASGFAGRIHRAWAAWYQGGDDEAKVYAVFRELKDKVQVSQVAKAYQAVYAENLIDTLNRKLSLSEINTILSIVRPLPAYRIL